MQADVHFGRAAAVALCLKQKSLKNIKIYNASITQDTTRHTTHNAHRSIPLSPRGISERQMDALSNTKNAEEDRMTVREGLEYSVS